MTPRCKHTPTPLHSGSSHTHPTHPYTHSFPTHTIPIPLTAPAAPGTLSAARCPKTGAQLLPALHDASVLELGAGPGAPGLAAARLGARPLVGRMYLCGGARGRDRLENGFVDGFRMVFGQLSWELLNSSMNVVG